MPHLILAGLVIALSLLAAPNLVAHCDTLDGPVVEAAKVALKKGDVTPVLKWVNKDSEKEVREAFAMPSKSARSATMPASSQTCTSSKHWFASIAPERASLSPASNPPAR
jgi:hypothetical protein